jgi:hypothetical protein
LPDFEIVSFARRCHFAASSTFIFSRNIALTRVKRPAPFDFNVNFR